MPSDRPDLLERLFHEAADLLPSERAAFLDRECSGYPAVRAELDGLLAEADRTDPAWNSSAVIHEARLTAQQRETGEFDRYRILDSIGSGGMGVVYKAVRTDEQIGQVVALKVVRAAAGPVALSRFLQERRILARLEHPNIARLIDAGTTRDGQPFLVMEYVDGRPLNQYIAEANPPLEARLRLFQKICAAVSCAHRSLIVHRDLKPGNILIARDGEPKLLDFGIATLVDGSALRTRTGAAALTPEYASPEQVRGKPIATSSDVYSLGVILYEMLAGASPYPKTSSPLALAEAITSGAPSSLNTGGSARFDPDLDRIVAMAMRREPERRYPSVDQFAADIQRYLDGYPVAARPDTRFYRMSKFARRNRIPLAAAVLTAIAVLGGVAATLRQARIANQRFRDVRTLANTYLFEIHDAIKDLPGSTPARQLVLKRAQEYLERLSQQRGNDPELGRELADAYSKVGAIQGQAGSASLGDRPAALRSYRKAVDILEPIVSANPNDTTAAKLLGSDMAEVSHLYGYVGDIKSAVSYARRAVEANVKLAAALPNDPEAQQGLGLSYMNLGDLAGNPNYQNLGDSKAAVDAYSKAEPVLARLRNQSPAGSPRRNLLGTLYGREAQMDQTLDNRAAAVDHYRKALDIDEESLRGAPLNGPFQWDAAAANRNLALSLVRANRAAEAEAYADKALALFRQYAQQDPANVDAQSAVADSLYAKGYIRDALKDPAGAIDLYRQSIAEYERVAAAHPAAGPAPGLRTAYQLLAGSCLTTGDAAGAITAAAKELEIDAALLRLNASNASAQRNQALASKQTGQAHQQLGEKKGAPGPRRAAELREARVWYQKALDVYLAQKSKGTLTPMYAADIDAINGYMKKCAALSPGM